MSDLSLNKRQETGGSKDPRGQQPGRMRNESITLKEAQDKISASDAKVAAAYKLARENKSSGRLNLDDIRRALKQMSHHPSSKKTTAPAGVDNRPFSGVIKRRGGGIAKRGFGIAK